MMSLPLSDVQLLPTFFFLQISLRVAKIVFLYPRSLKINKTY
jgi:hypothetical protein